MSADIDRENLRELCEAFDAKEKVSPGTYQDIWSLARALRSFTGAQAVKTAELEAENERLRAALAMSDQPCAYCSLPADDFAKCEHGFPGCSRADDALGCPHLGEALEAGELRSKIASLESERDQLKADNASLRERADAPEDRTWFWEIVDRDGLANVASDERQALADICRAAAERDQLRKQVKGQFVAGMKHAAEIINLPNWKGGIFSFMVRRQVHNQILSAAAALEQEEQG